MSGWVNMKKKTNRLTDEEAKEFDKMFKEFVNEYKRLRKT